MSNDRKDVITAKNEFIREINNLLTIEPPIRDKYVSVFKKENNDDVVLVYLHHTTKNIIKIYINYGWTKYTPVVQLLCEDINMKQHIEQMSTYIDLVDVINGGAKVHLTDSIINSIAFGTDV